MTSPNWSPMIALKRLILHLSRWRTGEERHLKQEDKWLFRRGGRDLGHMGTQTNFRENRSVLRRLEVGWLYGRLPFSAVSSHPLRCWESVFPGCSWGGDLKQLSSFGRLCFYSAKEVQGGKNSLSVDSQMLSAQNNFTPQWHILDCPPQYAHVYSYIHTYL